MTSRSEPRARWALAMLLLLAPATAAQAAPKGEPKKAAEVAVRAVKLYRAKQYKEAAVAFLEAYALSRRPAQLRNAAKAYEEGGFLDDAIPLWQSYLEHPAISRDERAEAEAHLKLVDEKKKNQQIVRQAEAARLAAEAARKDARQAQLLAADAARRTGAPAPAATAPLAVPPPEAPTPVGPVALLASGGAALVGGTILWIVQGSKLSSVDEKLAMKDEEGLIVGTTPEELRSELSTVNSLRGLSAVVLSVGGVAAISGLVWLLTEGGSGAEERPRRRELEPGEFMSEAGGEREQVLGPPGTHVLGLLPLEQGGLVTIGGAF